MRLSPLLLLSMSMWGRGWDAPHVAVKTSTKMQARDRTGVKAAKRAAKKQRNVRARLSKRKGFKA